MFVEGGRPRVWTASRGDTLFLIVRQIYGLPTDFDRLKRIAKLNNIRHFHRGLRPGRKIKVI